MTGPIRARQAIALAGMFTLCGCAIGSGALASAASTALVTRFDADRDGALSAKEVAAMVASAVPGKGADLDAVRAGIAAGYWTRDCDRDGHLSAGELAADKACP